MMRNYQIRPRKGTYCVVRNCFKTDGRVVVALGIHTKRKSAIGGVMVGVGVELKRTTTGGRVIGTGCVIKKSVNAAGRIAVTGDVQCERKTPTAVVSKPAVFASSANEVHITIPGISPVAFASK